MSIFEDKILWLIGRTQISMLCLFIHYLSDVRQVIQLLRISVILFLEDISVKLTVYTKYLASAIC